VVTPVSRNSGACDWFGPSHPAGNRIKINPFRSIRPMSIKAETSVKIESGGLGLRKKSVFARVPATLCLMVWVGLGVTPLLAGSAPADQTSSTGSTNPSENTRYGLFGLLDHRSDYGQGVFPEPFLVDDSDLEVNEARLDWLRTGVASSHSDFFTAEVEKGFGLLTLELEVHFERNALGGNVVEGFDNIDLGARYPLAQYVSPDGFIDTTVGVGFEVGIPPNSSISRNGEWVPKIFDDLRLGDHFTLQSIFGYSTLSGGGEDGDLQNFEYGFVLGYTIPHDELPIPGVESLIPVVEFSGATQLNHEDHGANSVLANIAFRANLKPIGGIQPRLGWGFVFPITKDARADTHWGVFTSLVFEY
jgi:hypothetical protein